MGSDEHRRSTQLCTQSIQATLATCRNWITETFKCNIDLHNLEDEAVLLRHAALHVDIDLPGAIHVLMYLPNNVQKVLKLKFFEHAERVHQGPQQPCIASHESGPQ